MPFEREIDEDAKLVIIRVRGCAATNDAMLTARELMKEPRLNQRYRLLIVVSELTKDSTPEELQELGDVLRLMRHKFSGRKAIVATDTGRLTTARIVALIASTHGDVEAFTTEDAARAWLFDDRP